MMMENTKKQVELLLKALELNEQTKAMGPTNVAYLKRAILSLQRKLANLELGNM